MLHHFSELVLHPLHTETHKWQADEKVYHSIDNQIQSVFATTSNHHRVGFSAVPALYQWVQHLTESPYLHKRPLTTVTHFRIIGIKTKDW